MDVILHLGAHRTATHSLQAYARRQAGVLTGNKMAFWPAQDAMGGAAMAANGSRPAGDIDDPATWAAQLADAVHELDRQQMTRLLVSCPDLLGTLGQNVMAGALYSQAKERVEEFAAASRMRVTTVLFSPRSLELYWCSALAQAVADGQLVPSRETLNRIAMSRRGWRDVVTDIAHALPEAAVHVLPFEQFAGKPDIYLRSALNIEVPNDIDRIWLNKRPELPALRRALTRDGQAVGALPFGMGCWNPFTNEEHAALREMYDDDMMWLTAGADGPATLTENCRLTKTGANPAVTAQTKGRCDGFQERKLARPG